MLFKEIVDARTDARTHGQITDDGRRTLKDHKSSLEHFVLRWAKNAYSYGLGILSDIFALCYASWWYDDEWTFYTVDCLEYLHIYNYTCIMYVQDCLKNMQDISLHHKAQCHLGQSGDCIYCILLIKRTCNVWRNVLFRICRSNGCQFKHSVNTLIRNSINTYHLLPFCEGKPL